MRANLKPFLARLALIALITLGLTVRLSAHDLPADRSLAESVTDNCFTSIRNRAAPASAQQISRPTISDSSHPSVSTLLPHRQKTGRGGRCCTTLCVKPALLWRRWPASPDYGSSSASQPIEVVQVVGSKLRTRSIRLAFSTIAYW